MKPSNFNILNKPLITNINYETNYDYFIDNPDGEISIAIDNNIEIQNVENENIAKVILSLYIFQNLKIEDVPFKLSVCIEGIFSWEDELNGQAGNLKSLLNQNAPAILYSYLRPLITIITNESGMPALVIPLMNFTK
ncbi:MAG: protein-export chaperone SecB [Proteocatella sp.]